MVETGAVRVEVEIPGLPLRATATYEPGMDRAEGNRWFAKVELGGVGLMHRAYRADWPTGEPEKASEFAEDADEAAAMVAAEFGRALKKVLEASPVWEG